MPSFSSAEGHDIHYRVLGEGDPVVLLHGWMVNGAIWYPITDALVAAESRLLVPDLRGAGQSSKPARGYELAKYAADVVALADAAGLDRFALVGHSMGGQIAQLAAAELGDRVSRLILLCPVPAAGMPLPPEAATLFRGCAGNPEAQSDILDMACKQLSAEGRKMILEMAHTVSAPCIEQAFDAWTGGGFADRLGEITASTKVIGTDDPFLTPDILRQAVVDPIRDAELIHIPGPGHYPQVEAPAATAAKLRELLA